MTDRLIACIFYLLCGFIVWISFFFFSSRRRHTRSDRDWSSDVCSSDLQQPRGTKHLPGLVILDLGGLRRFGLSGQDWQERGGRQGKHDHHGDHSANPHGLRLLGCSRPRCFHTISGRTGFPQNQLCPYCFGRRRLARRLSWLGPRMNRCSAPAIPAMLPARKNVVPTPTALPTTPPPIAPAAMPISRKTPRVPIALPRS